MLGGARAPTACWLETGDTRSWRGANHADFSNPWNMFPWGGGGWEGRRNITGSEKGVL